MSQEPSGRRLEWRGAEPSKQHLLAIDDRDAVVGTWAVDPEILRDFLNDMLGFDTADAEDGQRDGAPNDFGPLILARSEVGDILWIEPEQYWDGISDWFRSRGDDPHLHRSRDTPANRPKQDPT